MSKSQLFYIFEGKAYRVSFEHKDGMNAWDCGKCSKMVFGFNKEDDWYDDFNYRNGKEKVRCQTCASEKYFEWKKGIKCDCTLVVCQKPADGLMVCHKLRPMCEDHKHSEKRFLLFSSLPGLNIAREQEIKCECGADKLGFPGHSDWCKKYEEVN